MEIIMKIDYSQIAFTAISLHKVIGSENTEYLNTTT